MKSDQSVTGDWRKAQDVISKVFPLVIRSPEMDVQVLTEPPILMQHVTFAGQDGRASAFQGGHRAVERQEKEGDGLHRTVRR